MITFYEEKDLVSFGKYLLSEERVARVSENANPEINIFDQLQELYHADLESWKESQKQNNN
jgi:hypothetical protein